jgi:K(+)-stimulated pyrophosphate-energized sodium pump
LPTWWETTWATAGRGADLFESISAESLGAMILGAALATSMERAGTTFAGRTAGVTLFPLVVHSAGIGAAAIAVAATRLGSAGDPMRALNRGYALTLAIALGGFFAACRWLLDASGAPNAWWHFALCGTTGAASGIALVMLTQLHVLVNCCRR